jgi:hypothetical protein
MEVRQFNAFAQRYSKMIAIKMIRPVLWERTEARLLVEYPQNSKCAACSYHRTVVRDIGKKEKEFCDLDATVIYS